MNCFTHQAMSAVAICRACSKGTCAQCAMDIENGIVCSDACAARARDIDAIITRNKQILGIGNKAPAQDQAKTWISAIFFGLLSAVMWYVSANSYFSYGEIDLESVAFAVVFTVAFGLILRNHLRGGVDK